MAGGLGPRSEMWELGSRQGASPGLGALNLRIGGTQGALGVLQFLPRHFPRERTRLRGTSLRSEQGFSNHFSKDSPTSTSILLPCLSQTEKEGREILTPLTPPFSHWGSIENLENEPISQMGKTESSFQATPFHTSPTSLPENLCPHPFRSNTGILKSLTLGVGEGTHLGVLPNQTGMWAMPPVA